MIELKPGLILHGLSHSCNHIPGTETLQGYEANAVQRSPGRRIPLHICQHEVLVLHVRRATHPASCPTVPCARFLALAKAFRRLEASSPTRKELLHKQWASFLSWWIAILDHSSFLVLAYQVCKVSVQAACYHSSCLQTKDRHGPKQHTPHRDWHLSETCTEQPMTADFEGQAKY